MALYSAFLANEAFACFLCWLDGYPKVTPRGRIDIQAQCVSPNIFFNQFIPVLWIAKILKEPMTLQNRSFTHSLQSVNRRLISTVVLIKNLLYIEKLFSKKPNKGRNSLLYQRPASCQKSSLTA